MSLDLTILQTETLTIVSWIAACSALYCFVVGEITRNNSQMDKLWSILPAIYTWVIAVKGGMAPRLVIMAVLATAWGIRLTANFALKGAYTWKFWSGDEDYRWPWLRNRKECQPYWKWVIFDFFFISIYQNFLVLLTTLPAIVALGSDAPLGWMDLIAAVLMAFFIGYEAVADIQQWRFQSTKWGMIKAGKKLEELPAPYNKGFNTTGLWAVSRHPNYFAEQSIWVCFYLFSIAAGASVINWSIAGAILLILLFMGSSWLGEYISKSKYPEYKQYIRKVNRYFPGKAYVILFILSVSAVDLSAADKIERRKPLTANVGVVSVGLDTYWTQCPGLKEQMEAKTAVFVDMIKGYGVKPVDFGLVSNVAEAYDAVPRMKAADLDLLFVDMVTYATSSTFATFVRELGVPIVLVALQPADKMDYAHANIPMQLYNDDICALPEFTGVAERYGKPVCDCIIGKLYDDPAAHEQVRQWCAVSRVLHDLRRARIGLMGHVLEAMYDMQVDPTAISRTFGCHVALCEPDEILPFYREPDAKAVKDMKKRILNFFDTPDPVSDPWTEKLTDHDLDVAARAAVALEAFIAKRNLDGLAYYYEGETGSLTRELVTNFIVGNSLLTAAGFPMCGEFDLKNCIAMMIFDRLDIGGSFAEFHPVDFERGTVLVGHDGPHHLNIADGKPVLRSLKKYHGKPGKGAGVEFNIKRGPITMMSLGLKADGQFKFIIAEGESVDGPIPATGNTNTHGLFKPDVRTFLHDWVMEGPTHHFALGIGHHADELVKLARALGIEAVVVQPK